MIKTFLHTILLVAIPVFCLSQNGRYFDSAQNKSLDSLQHKLSVAPNDSSLIIAYERIGFFYAKLNTDSSLKYYNIGLQFARQKSYAWLEARFLAGLSGVMSNEGKFAEALELLFQSLKIAEKSKSGYDIARANRRISGVYFQLENYRKAITYILLALKIDQASQLKDKVAIDQYALADAYEKINKLDSASFYINMAIGQKEYLNPLMQYVYAIDGRIKQKKGNSSEAFIRFAESYNEAQKNSDLIASSQVCADISSLFLQINRRDSAIFYASKGYNYGKKASFKKGILVNCNLLAALYDSIQPSLALFYYKTAANAKDSLYGANNIQTIQNLLSREEVKQKQLEEVESANKEKIRLYGLLSGLAALLITAFLLFRNNLQKQKANVLLRQQKQQVESTLSELKSTQAQLIQSEKMASLGQLTAGIAHEIQNPLNFVNNFSEVNTELIDELSEEAEKGNLTEVKTIAKDIKENEEKISQHGKRADAIVKSMLQHSRTSAGQKEPTDINALCDEYLRLAYHGLKAKDKTFNVSIKTEFDDTIPLIMVIPQDIGRVLLNLINNAFYAVDKKAKSGLTDYQPEILVSTKKHDGTINISVNDNGDGIPSSIQDKIFQPFFTTKPTGQGTGLGLSLSYDIVKSHVGKLTVETKEGEGTSFSILLPE